MSDGVRQEGDELLKVVESLRSEADQFNKTVNDMYTSMKQVIGEEETKVEYGENGSFSVKYPDGTMICYGKNLL